MSDPPIPLLRARGVTLRLDPSLELGAGGEARVFALPGDAERVVKVFRHPTPERARKIARMIAAPPVLGPDPEGAVRLAWPQEGVVDEEGRPVGFLMPRAEGPRIFEFYNPVTRRTRAPLFHYGLLHRAGANLAAAFAALHERGYVVGDVNESNILVAPDGAVTLVDTDGFQVPDPATGAVYRSRVGRPEFTAPELQGVPFGAVDRTPEQDRFGLAVLLFLLLMEGTHPFAVRMAGGAEPEPLEERLRAGMFPYASERPGRTATPPRLALPFEVLHPMVRELFVRCFVDGHQDPAARPDAETWRASLREAEEELRRCDVNPQHRFGAHLGICPWCERARLLRGRDPFPATAEAASRVGTRIPRPAPPPVPAAAPAPRPRRPAPPAAPLPARALAAVQGSVTDPAVWVFPLLLLTMMPLGLGQLFAGILALVAALAALQPRSNPRNWSQLAAVMLLLTVAVGLTADAVSKSPDQVDFPDEVVVPPSPPPPFPPPMDDGRIYDITDIEDPPRLSNSAVVQRALERNYPPLLRDAGVGGTVNLRFVIRDDGSVDPASVEVLESDNAQFSQAAIVVVERMRFIPGMVNDRPVHTSVQLPITFQPETF
ncbi:MAG TPA: TonB family protein [Longimicrobium sp.]|nr:TonB family protein [Longimicrobium sp.]